jgi:hypothetical protein
MPSSLEIRRPAGAREMLRENNPVIGKKGINGEIRRERVKSYLRGSVPVQKSLVKPAGLRRGERRQCVPAMERNEGADRRYSGGWRFGLIDARASAPVAKRTGSPSAAGPDGCRRLPRRAFRVLRVATWRKWSFSRTIEDPRCSRLCGIMGGYKAVPKGLLYAAVHVTCVLRRMVWGSQLDQSSQRCGQSAATTKGRSSVSPSRPCGHGAVSPAIQSAFGWRCASSHLNPQPAKQHPALPATAASQSRTVSPKTGQLASR